MNSEAVIHRPALLKEAVDLLGVKPGKRYIDATIGSGGHATEILRRGGRVLGIDLDPEMVRLAKAHLQACCPGGHWQVVRGNFARIKELADKRNFLPVSGVIFDLGLNAYHYYQAGRGFSFRDDAPLDMRLSGQGITAAELLKRASKEKLEQILTKLAQEKFAQPIAQAIVRRRRQGELTARQLADLVEEVYQKEGAKKTRIHPATKTFLALRIWVNREKENLSEGLQGAFEILEPQGRLVVISFHSGEDRLVKSYFRGLVAAKKGQWLTIKPILPDQKEIKINPLARSAVLRGIKKK